MIISDTIRPKPGMWKPRKGSMIGLTMLSKNIINSFTI